MMMGGGKPIATDTPANPAAAQTDETTTLDHLSPSVVHTVSGSLDSGPADGVVQITLSSNGLTVPVEGASNNEGHLMRASDGYPQAFSFTFESPADVTGLELRILSATPGWVVTHTVSDNSKPTVQGQPPTSVPLVYEAGQTTATPTEDLETFRTFEPDPTVDAQVAAEYEIGWGQFVATALQSHGSGQASRDWSAGEEDYWRQIRDSATEPLSTAAEQNRLFWVGAVVRIDGGTPPSPWNSLSYLEMAYRWGWYSGVMANRPDGQDVVGISTWNADKLAYW